MHHIVVIAHSSINLCKRGVSNRWLFFKVQRQLCLKPQAQNERDEAHWGQNKWTNMEWACQPDTAQDDVSPLVGQSHYCIKSTQNPMFSWTWRKPKQNFKTQPKNEWSGWTGNMTSLADVGPPFLAMCQPRGTQAKSGRWRQTWCMIIPWFSIELTFSNKHVMPNHIL